MLCKEGGHEQLISNGGRFKRPFQTEIRSRQWEISKKSLQIGFKTSYVSQLGFLDCGLRDVKQEVMFDSARAVARKQRTYSSTFWGNKRKHNYLSFMFCIVIIDKYTVRTACVLCKWWLGRDVAMVAIADKNLKGSCSCSWAFSIRLQIFQLSYTSFIERKIKPWQIHMRGTYFCIWQSVILRNILLVPWFFHQLGFSQHLQRRETFTFGFDVHCLIRFPMMTSQVRSRVHNHAPCIRSHRGT